MLRNLPSVSELLTHATVQELIVSHGRQIVTGWIRAALDELRTELVRDHRADATQPAGQTPRLDGTGSNGNGSANSSSQSAGISADRVRQNPSQHSDRNGDRTSLRDVVIDRLVHMAEASECERIGQVINATGIVLHTGLGRSPLSVAARQALLDAAGATNVEVDVVTGQRRYRGYQLDATWQLLTGCEASLLVNNNAAATLLTLQALCCGSEVIISRGELVEIGGSFRLPEIFKLSGAKLREVGTTNRTTLSDYRQAIGPDTAAIMHVHPSNYRVVGFTARPSERELFELAHENGLIAIDDIGSGSLFDLSTAGLPAEPTFADSITCGADIVLGSGDKLLGGPQCGIMLGRKEVIEPCRNHPLARAVRIDKLTIAALSATLDPYLRGTAGDEIPTLKLLTTSPDELRERARLLVEELDGIDGLTVAARDDMAAVGGGSLPGVELPTTVISLRHDRLSAEGLSQRLRTGRIRVFARIRQDEVLIDLRSVLSDDDSRLALAVRLVRVS